MPAFVPTDLGDTIDGVPLIDSEKLEKIPRRLRQFAEFFVRLVLEEHTFYRFLPSLIGEYFTPVYYRLPNTHTAPSVTTVISNATRCVPPRRCRFHRNIALCPLPPPDMA